MCAVQNSTGYRGDGEQTDGGKEIKKDEKKEDITPPTPITEAPASDSLSIVFTSGP